MAPRASKLVSAALLLSACVSAPQPRARTQGAIADPIPEDPVMSRLALVLRDFASFPKSEPFPAPVDRRLMRHARINHLGEIPDGSRRMYVPDLNGVLYLLHGGTPRPYLDVRAAVGPSFFSGRGMGSGFGFVTFHPAFRENGKFYSVHTEAFDALTAKTPDLTPQPNTIVHGVVLEWTADDPRANTFSGSHREILRIGFATHIHGIQQIDFNPTASPGDEDYGLLYIAVGDGGTGVSTDEPQDLAVPQGKILRIDPAGTNSDNGRYRTPPSNPFVQSPGALGEIYAYGMRDPHRFSWDPAAGHRMFLGHIGEKHIEAIYEVKAADNLGWSEREGDLVYNKADRCALYGLPPDDEQYGYTYPVAAYDHNRPPGVRCGADVGRAISGGFVYRGDAVRELRGKYVFADIVDGRVMYTETRDMRRDGGLATIHELAIFDESGHEITMPMAAGDSRVDLRFGRDAEGELYLLSKANGKVWKVIGTRRVAEASEVHPALTPHLVAYYDFEHPASQDAAIEIDQGLGKTEINLVNGGRAMRVRDGAYRASKSSIQLQQVNPGQSGNDDWKAGIYSASGVESLGAFNGARGATVLGWFKMTGPNPSLNSNTPDPDDRYNAVGLAGILSGDSDGHTVRALLELITVNGTLRLVALGRRIDGGNTHVFAASQDWEGLLPNNEWVYLGATFDFDRGTMALYRNGKPLPGFYSDEENPWDLIGPGPFVTSATDPRGIKIGGSFPQNTREANPCNCRADGIMFLDRVLTPLEINQQYRRMISAR